MLIYVSFGFCQDGISNIQPEANNILTFSSSLHCSVRWEPTRYVRLRGKSLTHVLDIAHRAGGVA